jgi:hypothetical protein
MYAFCVDSCFLRPVSTLSKKFDKAKSGLNTTKEAFDELSATLDGELLESWKEEERKAQATRGEALRIYDVRLEQGIHITYVQILR